MKRTGPTHAQLRTLIIELRRHSLASDAPLWRRIADDLVRPTRMRRVVNLHRISRNTAPDDVVIVPGKVLSDGELDHKLTVAAFTFSKSAKEKIKSIGGTVATIDELMRSNAQGTKIKIIG